MKLNTSVILGIIIGVLLLFIFVDNSCENKSNDTPNITKVDSTKTKTKIPEKVGDFKSVLPTPEKDTIYLDSIVYVPVKEEPDTSLLEKYKKENDSLKRQLMYEQAITKNSYLEKFDNKDLSLTIEANTTGTLDKLSILRYNIKEQEITTYQITKYIESDKFELYGGGQLGIPTQLDEPFKLKGDALLKKKDIIYSIGIDNAKTVYTGLYYRFL